MTAMPTSAAMKDTCWTKVVQPDWTASANFPSTLPTVNMDSSGKTTSSAPSALASSASDRSTFRFSLTFPVGSNCPTLTFMAHSRLAGVLYPSSLPSGTPQDSRGRAVGVGLGSGPVADADTHRGPALPGRAGEPERAVGLHAPGDFAGEFVRIPAAGRVEADQHLVEHDVVEHLGAAVGQAVRHPPGEAAAAFDQAADARAAQSPQGGVDGEAAGPAGGLRHPGNRVPLGLLALALALAGRVLQVGRVRRGQGAGVRGGVGDDRQPG